MRLRSEQLGPQLQQKLAPVYLVTGDETLIVQECCDLIRSRCRQLGFTEREVYHAEASFDWNELLQSANALSLFADRKIIELRLPSGKLNDAGKKALESYCKQLNEDTVLLISAPKMDAATLKAAWANTIDQAGVILQIWPMEFKQLPGWLGQRAKALGLAIDTNALQLIADRVEGNLLAAQQELEKLAMTGSQSAITVETVLASVADSTRYSVFDLVDRCLAGDAPKALRVAAGLRQEGEDALGILWALLREIRRLLGMRQQMDKGQALPRLMQNNGVRPQQQALFQQALNRLTVRHLYDLLALAEKADMAAKGMSKDDPWLLTNDLVLQLAGTRLKL